MRILRQINLWTILILLLISCHPEPDDCPITTSLGTTKGVSNFANGTKDIDYPNADVPLLQSFYFRFPSGDAELQYMGIEPNTPEDGLSRIGFNNSRRSEYFYNIRYYDLVPASIGSDFSIGVMTGVDILPREMTIPPPPEGEENYDKYAFVLRGFSFGLTGARDQQIQTISIEENKGRLTVNFKNKETPAAVPVIWKVWYAWIP